MTTQTDLLPCPFCGVHITDLQDAFHPSGIYWRDLDMGGEIMRSYHSRRELQDGDGRCWIISCLETSGGCGANISGDDREETIQKWNTRSK